MNNKKTNILLLLILSVIISGCNFPTAKEENVDEQKDIAVATIVAQTLTALENQAQPTPTPIEEVPTLTAMPTLEVPVPTQLTVAPVSSYNQKGCLIASTISETIPDDFTKWEVAKSAINSPQLEIINVNRVIQKKCRNN